jgi:hypothetical protein
MTATSRNCAAAVAQLAGHHAAGAPAPTAFMMSTKDRPFRKKLGPHTM